MERRVAIHGMDGRDATEIPKSAANALTSFFSSPHCASGLTTPSSRSAWIPGRYTCRSLSLWFVHHARNPLFFCKIQKCREQVVFADITAVDRIRPDGFQLHLIDLDNFMDRAQLLCHPLRDLQITGWVQHGVKCHGITGIPVFFAVSHASLRIRLLSTPPEKGDTDRCFRFFCHELFKASLFSVSDIIGLFSMVLDSPLNYLTRMHCAVFQSQKCLL